MDQLFEVDAVPTANEKVQAQSASFSFGGPASNGAATAGALGSPVRLVTVVGHSPLDGYLRSSLGRYSVRLEDLAEDQEGYPAISTVFVTGSTGERAVISANGAQSPQVTELPLDFLRGVQVLLLDGHHMATAIEIARLAKSMGIVVVFDGGSWKPRTEELLAWVDCAIVSKDFAVPGEESPLRWIESQGVRFAAQSNGEAPISVIDYGESYELPVKQLGSIVDTLGAGDVLHGAFIHAVAEGLSYRESLTFASAIASESCAHRGALGWVGHLVISNPRGRAELDPAITKPGHSGPNHTVLAP